MPALQERTLGARLNFSSRVAFVPAAMRQVKAGTRPRMTRARKCAEKNAGKMPALRKRTLGARLNFSCRGAAVPAAMRQVKPGTRPRMTRARKCAEKNAGPERLGVFDKMPFETQGEPALRKRTLGISGGRGRDGGRRGRRRCRLRLRRCWWRGRRCARDFWRRE